MAKRESRTPYSVEVQKGPIRMDEQYSLDFRRQPEALMRDLEDNRMRHEKMTLTLHTPKQ